MNMTIVKVSRMTKEVILDLGYKRSYKFGMIITGDGRFLTSSNFNQGLGMATVAVEY